MSSPRDALAVVASVPAAIQGPSTCVRPSPRVPVDIDPSAQSSSQVTEQAVASPKSAGVCRNAVSR